MKIQNKKYNLLNVCTSKKTTVGNLLKKILKVWNVNKSILVKGNTLEINLEFMVVITK